MKTILILLLVCCSFTAFSQDITATSVVKIIFKSTDSNTIKMFDKEIHEVILIGRAEALKPFIDNYMIIPTCNCLLKDVAGCMKSIKKYYPVTQDVVGYETITNIHIDVPNPDDHNAIVQRVIQKYKPACSQDICFKACGKEICASFSCEDIAEVELCYHGGFSISATADQ
jgi:hypothetical protein